MIDGQFRNVAGALPGVSQVELLDRLIFRVKGVNFATEHWPERGMAVVKLLPEDHARLTADLPAARREPGTRGRNGVVVLDLAGVDDDALVDILTAAWRRAYAEATGAVSIAAQAVQTPRPVAQS